MTNEGNGTPPFSRPRAVGGLALLGLAIALMLIDSISDTFALDSIQLGLIFGTALLLLGVEAGRKFIR